MPAYAASINPKELKDFTTFLESRKAKYSPEFRQ